MDKGENVCERLLHPKISYINTVIIVLFFIEKDILALDF